MADRRPLTVVSGAPAEMPSGDTLPDAVIPSGITRDSELSAAVAGRAARGVTIHVSDYAVSGAADSTTGIADAFTAAAAVTVASLPDAYDGVTGVARKPRVVFDGGLWNITDTITIPLGVDVEIQHDAIVRAVPAEPMGPVFATALDVVHQHALFLCQGTIDCNDLASAGMYLPSFAVFSIITPEIVRPAQAGIVLGDPESTLKSYGGYIIRPNMWRPNGDNVPSDSAGVSVYAATDCRIGGAGSVIQGFDQGIWNSSDSGNNLFHDLHVWGYPASDYNDNDTSLLPSECFLDDGIGSVYIGCLADSPSSSGWKFTADNPKASLQACKCYLNTAITDDTVNCVDITSATTGSVTSIGLEVLAEPGHFAATDFSGTLTGSVRVGTRPYGVVTPVGDAGWTADALTIGTVDPARLPRNLSPVTNIGSTLTGTVSTDASSGGNFRDGTMTGNIILSEPTSATDGQVLHFRLLASGGTRTVGLGAGVVNASGVTFPLSVASGKLGRLSMERMGLLSAWVVTAAAVTP